MIHTARFLCSLNKKHTHEEVFSFEIDVPVSYGEDIHSEGVRYYAKHQACDSDKLPKEYKPFNGTYWMDAICIEPKGENNE